MSIFRPRHALALAATAAALAGAGDSAAQALAPGAAERAVLTASTPPASPAVAGLRHDLERIVRAAGGGSVQSAVLVTSLDRGDTLYSLNPDLALAPASNLKLYSTGAALYYLGPDYRYRTSLLADGPIRDGVLEGDLILHGTGDPTLSGRMLPSTTSTFRAFADSLLALGVRRVRGDVVGDGSYFDDAWVGSAWQPSDLMAWYGAPVGALSYAENMVTVRVQPGATGAAARISTTPATRGLALENRVRTVSTGSTRLHFEHGDSAIVVTGQIRRGHAGATRALPVVDPANYAAAGLRAVLEEAGIRVEGETRSVRRASDSRVAGGGEAGGEPPRLLAVHFSPRLAEIAAVTNHVSHNLFADALLKTAGRVAAGEGSFDAGARAVRVLLAHETAADPARLQILDGSGLSHTDRVTARSTIELLDYMTRSGVWEAYYESLPEAAAPGGLRRMYGTRAAGNLRAKTGTIRTVSALSGYVRAADGENLLFSIITNGIPSTARAKEMENQVGARIASFRREESDSASR